MNVLSEINKEVRLNKIFYDEIDYSESILI